MAKPKPKRRGRPPFDPTDRQRGMVLGMALWNTPIEEMRQRILGSTGRPLNFRTFKKVFAEELLESLTNVETNLATAMYKFGLKEKNHQDRRFILACKFGWKEAQVFETDGDDVPNLTPEQEDELLKNVNNDLENI